MKKVQELLRIDDRVAIITGGAGHLGLAFGEALAELGARVVVVDREASACEARVNDLRERFKTEGLPLAIDLAADDAGKRIVDATMAKYKRIDIVVNNAGFTGMSGLKNYVVPFAQQSLESWDLATRVNITAAFLLCQAAEEPLKQSGRGSIVNVSSIYGVVGPDMSLYEGTPMGNPAVYAATKAGLIQLTKYLSTVLAPKVRVNAITPGGIERGQLEVFQARYKAKTPLGRMGIEEDFKGAMALLASDAGAYITGQNLIVDGGWTAW